MKVDFAHKLHARLLYQYSRVMGYGLYQPDRQTSLLLRIGTSHKLATYNYTSSLAISTMLEYELVDASLPRYPKCQGRTCYQECGCHL